MVTVAVRRINILDKKKPILTDYLNPKKIIINSNFSLFDLLKKYKLSHKKVAVEHNGVIVPKIGYRKKNLKNNDKVEIVHFIGGG